MNKVILTVLAIVVLLGGAGIFWYSTRQTANPSEEIGEMGVLVEEELLDEKEEAIETQQEVTESALSEEEDKEMDNAGETVAQLLAEKYDKDISEVTLTVSQELEDYATGGVRFEGEIGGAWWLAARVDGKWVLVDDGNGVMMCDVIEPYDFPAEIVPECFDESTGLPVTR